jgi:hypothetical protein
MMDANPLFSEEDDPFEDVHPTLRIEVQEAIDRVMRLKRDEIHAVINIDDPVPTQNPYVDCIYVTVMADKGTYADVEQYTVWVDDFEVVVTFVDNPW